MSSGVILRKKSMRGAQQQQVWYHRLVSCPVGPLGTLGETGGGDSPGLRAASSASEGTAAGHERALSESK